MQVKFMYNGIKINGELAKGTWNFDKQSKEIFFRARDYKSIPQFEGVKIINNSDIQSDYFEKDKIYFDTSNIHYQEALKAFNLLQEKIKIKAEKREEKRNVKNETFNILSDNLENEQSQVIAEETQDTFLNEIELQSELNYQKIVSSFSWCSFNPEQRAKSLQKEFSSTVINLYEKLKKLDPNRIIEIQEDILYYKKVMLKEYNEFISAKSRTASPAVTGPAKFNFEKNNKKIEIAMKKYDSLLSKKSYFENKFKTKYTIIKTKGEADFIKEIERTKSYILEGTYDNNLLKAALVRKLIKAAKENLDTCLLIEKLILESMLFTSKHHVFKDLKQIQTSFSTTKDIALNNEYIIKDIKIIDNQETNRIEIFFPGIPSQDIRNFLKSKSFKWSPTKGAWQNYRNSTKLETIKEYLGGIC